MHKLFILILLFSLLQLPAVKAQNSGQKLLYISGSVIDDSTGQNIGSAYIFNESSRIGYAASEEGNFILQADVGDTLVFTALGYFGKVVLVSNILFGNDTVVTLIPRFYNIEEVDIFAYGSYEVFKKKFLALESHKTQTLDLRNDLYLLAHKEAQIGFEEGKVRRAMSPQPGTEPMNGIPILYKEDLQRINYARVLKLEEKQRIIDKKYNYEIVKKVTKLPDNEIIDFMSYCNFSMQYLLNTSEYDILVKIEEKFIEFMKKKPHGELLEKPEYDFYCCT